MEQAPKFISMQAKKLRVERWGLCLLAYVATVSRIHAQPLDARKILEHLNNVAIDPSQVYVLRDAQITRDRVKLYFNRGFIGFFTKVSGEITGAVFSGDGEILLIPPDPVEKRNLARFIKSPILEERFNSAYMRFTDQTARELLSVSRKPDPEDSEQPTGFREHWNPVVRSLSPANSARLLVDLLGDRGYPYFLARIQGVNLPVFDVRVDERMPEAVSVSGVGREGGLLYNDIWCSFASKASVARSSSLVEGQARVLSYGIDTRILPDHSLEGRAELQLESLSGDDRLLVFDLSRWIKVQEVKDERGQNLVVVQNPSDESALRSDDRIEVVLPSPHPVADRFRLVFTYHGNVIADVGNGVLYVGARGSWYPNRPQGPLATYNLTFHCPEKLTLVATGTRVEEKSADGWAHSRWRADEGFRVAGFNLGPYHSVARRVGKTTVEIYATPEAEAGLEKLRAAAQPLMPLPPTSRREPRRWPPEAVSGPVIPLAPAALLHSVGENAEHAVEYFEKLFGPFPYPRLAISQIPGRFGQGWPELVYLPTLAFLPRSQRSEMGLGGKSSDLVQQGLLPHEIAHQWWGNLVGWRTYHDQWLSEGLASYAAALYLAQEKDGEDKFRETLRGYKRDLLAKTKEGATVESGGPIWLGRRLSNSLNPDGYTNIVYKKACWVLHMLRSLLTDPATGSDERFFKMLRGFIAAHRGEEVATEDFIRSAEKYMTGAIDLEHNRRLDWFFSEWVYDTGIPAYKLEASTRQLAPGKFVVQGTIEQSGVSEDFEMLVPVIAVYGRDKKVVLGRVAVAGEIKSRFRFSTRAKPARVAIDEENLLAIVQ